MGRRHRPTARLRRGLSPMSSVEPGTHSRPGRQSFQRIVARRRILVAAAIAAVGLATAVTLVLHERDPGPCDAERLEADARALDTAIERWSPHDGRIPDFLTPAASAVWKACGDEMPQEFRWYLDFAVPHPRPPHRRGAPSRVGDSRRDTDPGDRRRLGEEPAMIADLRQQAPCRAGRTRGCSLAVLRAGP